MSVFTGPLAGRWRGGGCCFWRESQENCPTLNRRENRPKERLLTLKKERRADMRALVSRIYHGSIKRVSRLRHGGKGAGRFHMSLRDFRVHQLAIKLNRRM